MHNFNYRLMQMEMQRGENLKNYGGQRRTKGWQMGKGADTVDISVKNRAEKNPIKCLLGISSLDRLHIT